MHFLRRNKFIVDSGIFLLMIAFSLVTFRFGVTEFDRGDQPWYLNERTLIPDNWDWFWHSFSYSRTRLTSPGDIYLFRPFHMALLALETIFFNFRHFPVGIFSIVSQGIAGYVLFRFGRLLVSPWLAVIIGFFYIAGYAGLEIVAWRHISPYIFSFTLLCIALTLLLSKKEFSPFHLFVASILLFCGSLFHELILISSGLCFITFLGLNFWKKPREENSPFKKKVIWLFLIPIVLNLSANLVDFFIYYEGASFLGPRDHIATKSLKEFFASFAFTLGPLSISFLSPFFVSGGVTKNILSWQFTDVSKIIMLINIVLVVAFCSYVYWKSIKGYLQGKSLSLCVVGIGLVNTYIGFILGLALGRAFLRNTLYLIVSTYYYAINAFLLSSIFLLFLYLFMQERKSNHVKKFITIGVAVVVSLYTWINYNKIQERLIPVAPVWNSYVYFLQGASDFFTENPDQYCLWRALSVEVTPHELRLHQYRCKTEDTRTPLSVTPLSQGEWGFKKRAGFNIPKERWNSQDFSFDPSLYSFEKSKFFSPHPGGSFTQGEGGVVSNKPCYRCNVMVDMENVYYGGVIIGYDDPQNFTLLVFQYSEVYPLFMEEGVLRKGPLGVFPARMNLYQIEIQYIEEELYLFVNNIFSLKTKAPDVQGKIGFFIQENKNSERLMSFSEPMISRPSPPLGNTLIKIEISPESSPLLYQWEKLIGIRDF